MNDIAVCILFFNKAAQTIEGVRSFAASGAPVYVLNNGSSEAAAREVCNACDQWDNVHYLTSDTNLGCGGGRNQLVALTTEPWLLFVDNDIAVRDERWLPNLQAHVTHSREIDVIVPRIFNVWDGTYIRPVRLGVKDGNAVYEDPGSDYTNVFPGGGSLVSRELFTRVGLYDDELLAFEDFELALRAMRQGREIRVRHIHDVELLHDHRVVQRDDDKEAVAVRYDSARVGRAHDKVERTYGVSFDRNYETWLAEQVRSMTASQRRVGARDLIRNVAKAGPLAGRLVRRIKRALWSAAR